MSIQDITTSEISYPSRLPADDSLCNQFSALYQAAPSPSRLASWALNSTHTSPDDQQLPLTPDRLRPHSSSADLSNDVTMLGQGYNLPESNKYTSPTNNFAFEAPQTKVTNTTTVTYPLSGQNSTQFSLPTGTMSGNVTPNEALPRISRDFAPPPIDTRRPATAAAALHGRDFAALKRGSLDDIREHGGFQNPFASPAGEIVPSQAPAVDPHYVSSDSTQWQPQTASQTGLAYPATAVGAPNYGYNNGLASANQQRMNRPQTSDGLPSYPQHMGALPPARTLVNHMGSYQSNVAVPAGYGSVSVQGMGGYQRYGGSFPNPGANRYMMGQQDDMQFVPLSGPTPKKRARRRYDEIERIYACEWKGCDKAYGTLNHLNAHVAMQKHGEKRLPAQFKDMRKEWRRKKREEAATAASKEYAAQAAAAAAGVEGPNQSQQYYDARHSADASMYTGGGQQYNSGAIDDPFSHRSSTGSFLTSAPTWSGSDTRPTTANTVSSGGGSPTDSRFAYTSTNSWGNVNGQYDARVNGAANGYDRKVLNISTQLGGRVDTDYSTPTQATPTFNPYTMAHHNLI